MDNEINGTPRACRCAICGDPIPADQPRMTVMVETPRAEGRPQQKQWGKVDQKCWARIAGSPQDVVAVLKAAAKRPLKAAETSAAA
jgi:hypothetical protein